MNKIISYFQIGSLTGRSMPQPLREKLRNQQPSVNMNIRVQQSISSSEPHNQPMTIERISPSADTDLNDNTIKNYGDVEDDESKRNSSTLSRAAFWDSRIDHGQTSDNQVNLEFPTIGSSST